MSIESPMKSTFRNKTNNRNKHEKSHVFNEKNVHL
jgi:hypothetical protein